MASKILYMLLKCSLKASVIILVVMALRPLLKKVSHSVTCLLWAAVGLALACPVPLATRWSVFPGMTGSSEKLYEKISTVTGAETQVGAVGSSGSQVTSELMNRAGSNQMDPTGVVGNQMDTMGNQLDMVGIQNGTIMNQPDQGFCDNLLSQVSVWLHGLTMADYILAVWLVGMCAILMYALVRYIKLKKRMEISVKLRDNIYECDEIVSPFVMGVVNPKIYLPSNLESELRPSVLLHEQAHVARHDQLWKYASLILLAIHWFNPLVWASYVLFGRDMELACRSKN